MYRAPFSFRACLPQQSPGDLNLQYTGSFDEVYDELVADGYAVEVLGLDRSEQWTADEILARAA
jgi:hypothetical protein